MILSISSSWPELGKIGTSQTLAFLRIMSIFCINFTSGSWKSKPKKPEPSTLTSNKSICPMPKNTTSTSSTNCNSSRLPSILCKSTTSTTYSGESPKNVLEAVAKTSLTRFSQHSFFRSTGTSSSTTPRDWSIYCRIDKFKPSPLSPICIKN